MTLISVIIPTLNEGENIRKLIGQVKNKLKTITKDYEIIIIDGHSKDDTVKNARIAGAEVFVQKEFGFGVALKEGFAHARGEYVITLDGDLSHSPDIITVFWDERNNADVLIGSRYVQGGTADQSITRKVLSRTLNTIFSFGLSIPIKDLSSNLRMYKRSVLEEIKITGINFDVLPEIIIRAFSRGFQIKEVPMQYRSREYGVSKSKLFSFGRTYLKTFLKLWGLRNSIASCDYDARAHNKNSKVDTVKKFKICMFILVFVISFFWVLSLTYNFNFFWEDGGILADYAECQAHPEKCSVKSIFVLFLDTVFQKSQFKEIRYGWKPVQEQFLYPFLVSVAGNNLLYHRILKAILVAMLFTQFFIFLYKPTEILKARNIKTGPNVSKNEFFVPILSISYLMVLPEIWIATLYYSDTLVLTLFFSTLALLLFYFFYNDDKIKNKAIVWVLFILIVFLTQLSILTKHVGRTNFLVIALFLLFTDNKKYFKMKYVCIIITLVFLSVPIIGMMNMLSGTSFYEVSGLKEHINADEKGVFSMTRDFLSTSYLSFLPHAKFLSALLILFTVLHVYAVWSRKQRDDSSTAVALKNITIFSCIWFVLEAGSMFLARGFVFEQNHFLRLEFSIFLFPQMLAIVSYVQWVYQSYFRRKKLCKQIICIFLILAIAQNAIRLNEWRGGWGAYYLGYDTARKYVDAHEKNAVMLVKYDGAATYFTSNNTIKVIVDLTNQSLIWPFTRNYSSVLIASWQQIDFKNARIQSVANLTIVDDSPYGKVKNLIGRYYSNKIYVYKVKNMG